MENVQRDLRSILTTGVYSYQELKEFTYGHPFEIILRFTHPVDEGEAATGNCAKLVEEWKKDQISDFEQRLALVDKSDTTVKEEDIQRLLEWNEVRREANADYGGETWLLFNFIIIIEVYNARNYVETVAPLLFYLSREEFCITSYYECV